MRVGAVVGGSMVTVAACGDGDDGCGIILFSFLLYCW